MRGLVGLLVMVGLSSLSGCKDRSESELLVQHSKPLAAGDRKKPVALVMFFQGACPAGQFNVLNCNGTRITEDHIITPRHCWTRSKQRAEDGHLRRRANQAWLFRDHSDFLKHWPKRDIDGCYDTGQVFEDVIASGDMIPIQQATSLQGDFQIDGTVDPDSYDKDEDLVLVKSSRSFLNQAIATFSPTKELAEGTPVFAVSVGATACYGLVLEGGGVEFGRDSARFAKTYGLGRFEGAINSQVGGSSTTAQHRIDLVHYVPGAGPVEDQTLSCVGDSGMGIYTRAEGKDYLLGVHVRGGPVRDPGQQEQVGMGYGAMVKVFSRVGCKLLANANIPHPTCGEYPAYRSSVLTK